MCNKIKNSWKIFLKERKSGTKCTKEHFCLEWNESEERGENIMSILILLYYDTYIIATPFRFYSF